MDVFIKSFGRPYYLDRCIRSVVRFLKGDYTIVVLDDGTPMKYVHHLQSLYPTVAFRFSPYAQEKRESIEKHINGDRKFELRKIPVAFWKSELEIASEYFLLLEEDAWLTEQVDIAAIVSGMKKNNTVINKLFWGNSDQIISGTKKIIDDNFELIKPAVPVSSMFVMRPFLQNKFWIRSILLRLKIISPGHLLPYYNLYTVSSAIYQRDYWLYCLRESPEVILETNQLLHALEWYVHHPESTYAKTPNEKVKTSYQTASVNVDPSVDFDMICFNNHVNESWLKGKIDVLQNHPDDFSPEYLITQSALPATGSCSAKNWLRWMETFRKQYEDLGIETR